MILREHMRDRIKKHGPRPLQCLFLAGHKPVLFKLGERLADGKLKSVLNVMSLYSTCSASRLGARLHLVLFPGIK